MCNEENSTTLYNPVPKKDLVLPPMVQGSTEDSVGSLPTKKAEATELREVMENLSLNL